MRQDEQIPDGGSIRQRIDAVADEAIRQPSIRASPRVNHVAARPLVTTA